MTVERLRYSTIFPNMKHSCVQYGATFIPQRMDTCNPRLSMKFVSLLTIVMFGGSVDEPPAIYMVLHFRFSGVEFFL